MSRDRSGAYPRKCVICGKEFTVKYANYVTQTCSKECSTELRKAVWKTKKELEKKREEKLKTKKPAMSIAEVNAKARELHLTYGQYMAKYGV